MRRRRALAGNGLSWGVAHADLELIAAALDGRPEAQKTLKKEVISAARVATRNMPELEGDLVQDLLQSLLTPKPADSKLHSYRATGSLRSWLRTMAVRGAIKLQKKAARETPTEAEFLDRVSDQRISPELALFKTTHQAQFATIFTRALAELEPRQRNMLKLKYLDQLTVQEIGRAYGVHHSSVVRALQKTQDVLLARVKQVLADELQLSQERVESAIGALVSGLHPSVWRGLD
jgi:RNA polymerase sigma-70 factor (ECF subfamily)